MIPQQKEFEPSGNPTGRKRLEILVDEPSTTDEYAIVVSQVAGITTTSVTVDTLPLTQDNPPSQNLKTQTAKWYLPVTIGGILMVSALVLLTTDWLNMHWNSVNFDSPHKTSYPSPVRWNAIPPITQKPMAVRDRSTNEMTRPAANIQLADAGSSISAGGRKDDKDGSVDPLVDLESDNDVLESNGIEDIAFVESPVDDEMVKSAPQNQMPGIEELQRQRQEAAARDAVGGISYTKSPVSVMSGSGSGAAGSGMDEVGGSGPTLRGFSNRSVLYRPKITDIVQKNATVVIRICVNPQGSVVSANFTLSGSEGAVPSLVTIAERNARSWKFEEISGEENQCGAIVYRFTVQ